MAVIARAVERQSSMRIKTVFAALLFSAAMAFGQTGTATLRGLVKDSSAAIIPHARVSAIEGATGAAAHTETNDTGLYVFPALQPGHYKLTAESAGLRTWVGELDLQTGQSASLDVLMEVASTSTEVTVAGDVSALVTTADATLATTIERQRIEQLPLNGRSLTALIQFTTPGAETGSANGATRIYGMREGSLEIVQDGSAVYDMRRGGGYARMPGLDTVEEFRIESNNASAKNNRPAKAILKTRSGTNQFHGAMFETARNNGLGLARRREDFYSKPPTLIRNEYGASAGGPILLPGIYDGRNRTFIFGSYEGMSLRQSNTAGASLPTEAMRQGDFSGLVNGQGQRYTLYDPWSATADWSKTPYPNNQIPVALRSPLATAVYKILPLPTMPYVNPLVGNNYFGPSPNNRTDQTGTLRVDHRLSEKDQFFVRYMQGFTDQVLANGGTSPVATDLSTNVRALYTPNRTVAASWTRLFTPTWFAETSLSYGREQRSNITGDQTKDYATALGLPNPFAKTGFPEISSTGFDSNTSESNQSFIDKTRIWTLQENMTKVIGRHELEFGGTGRLSHLDIRPQEQYVKGYYQFNSLATALYDPKSGSKYAAVARTGFDAANLFLGIPALARVNKMRPWYHMSGKEYSGYFQDNFKVNPRLTLNLGVRIESFPIVHEANNLLTSFDPKNLAIVIGQPMDTLYSMGVVNSSIIGAYTALGAKFETPDKAALPSATIYTDRAYIEPRFGLAYRLSSGVRPFVLRGGYSRYGYPVPLAGYYARSRTDAPMQVRFDMNVNTAAQSPDAINNYLLRHAPVYVIGKNAQNLISVDNPTLGGIGSVNVSYYDPYQPITKSDQWNITVEREVLRNTMARVSLLGNHTGNLDQIYDWNEPKNDYVWFVGTGQPLPQGATSAVARRPLSSAPYGTLETLTRKGWSNFVGFQAQIERRFSRGIGFQAFYLMSNARRAGGNDWRDDVILDPWVFLPGSVPDDFDKRNRFLNYHLDAEIPKHHVRWNWVVELPFGHNKRFARNAGRLLDSLIGGWQLAGIGNLASQYFPLQTSYLNIQGNIEVYGKKYPVQDCRSGSCIQSYLYFNGYIPANRINSYDANGKPNGVMGVPADYKPAFTPLIPMPKDGGNTADPSYQYLGSNTVYVKLANGTMQPVVYDNGLHPWRNQWMLGPMSWTMDASLFKAVRVTERMQMRFNADFFNVFNMPGINLPGSDSGLISMQTSANDPRQLQLTLRLMW
jgi:hypothetical protein